MVSSDLKIGWRGLVLLCLCSLTVQEKSSVDTPLKISRQDSEPLDDVGWIPLDPVVSTIEYNTNSNKRDEFTSTTVPSNSSRAIVNTFLEFGLREPSTNNVAPSQRFETDMAPPRSPPKLRNTSVSFLYTPVIHGHLTSPNTIRTTTSTTTTTTTTTTTNTTSPSTLASAKLVTSSRDDTQAQSLEELLQSSSINEANETEQLLSTFVTEKTKGLLVTLSPFQASTERFNKTFPSTVSAVPTARNMSWFPKSSTKIWIPVPISLPPSKSNNTTASSTTVTGPVNVTVNETTTVGDNTTSRPSVPNVILHNKLTLTHFLTKNNLSTTISNRSNNVDPNRESTVDPLRELVMNSAKYGLSVSTAKPEDISTTLKYITLGWQTTPMRGASHTPNKYSGSMKNSEGKLPSSMAIGDSGPVKYVNTVHGVKIDADFSIGHQTVLGVSTEGQHVKGYPPTYTPHFTSSNKYNEKIMNSPYNSYTSYIQYPSTQTGYEQKKPVYSTSTPKYEHKDFFYISTTAPSHIYSPPSYESYPSSNGYNDKMSSILYSQSPSIYDDSSEVNNEYNKTPYTTKRPDMSYTPNYSKPSYTSPIYYERTTFKPHLLTTKYTTTRKPYTTTKNSYYAEGDNYEKPSTYYVTTKPSYYEGESTASQIYSTYGQSSDKMSSIYASPTYAPIKEYGESDSHNGGYGGTSHSNPHGGSQQPSGVYKGSSFNNRFPELGMYDVDGSFVAYTGSIFSNGGLQSTPNTFQGSTNSLHGGHNLGIKGNLQGNLPSADMLHGHSNKFQQNFGNNNQGSFRPQNRPFGNSGNFQGNFQNQNNFGSGSGFQGNFGNQGSSSNNFGNQGSSSNNFGNQGSSSNNFGNQGSSSINFGNQGSSSNNFGNQGSSSNNFGNQGSANTNFGLQSSSNNFPNNFQQNRPNDGSNNNNKDEKKKNSKLQKVMLAIGMSVIPTATIAFLVGFPSLIGRRKRRDLGLEAKQFWDDVDVLYEKFMSIKNLTPEEVFKVLEEVHLSTTFRRYVDTFFQPFLPSGVSSVFSLKHYRTKRALSKKESTNQEDGARELITVPENAVNGSGIVFFTAKSNISKTVLSPASRKRQGNGIRIKLKHQTVSPQLAFRMKSTFRPKIPLFLHRHSHIRNLTTLMTSASQTNEHFEIPPVVPVGNNELSEGLKDNLERDNNNNTEQANSNLPTVICSDDEATENLLSIPETASNNIAAESNTISTLLVEFTTAVPSVTVTREENITNATEFANTEESNDLSTKSYYKTTTEIPQNPFLNSNYKTTTGRPQNPFLNSNYKTTTGRPQNPFLNSNYKTTTGRPQNPFLNSNYKTTTEKPQEPFLNYNKTMAVETVMTVTNSSENQKPIKNNIPTTRRPSTVKKTRYPSTTSTSTIKNEQKTRHSTSRKPTTPYSIPLSEPTMYEVSEEIAFPYENDWSSHIDLSSATVATMRSTSKPPKTTRKSTLYSTTPSYPTSSRTLEAFATPPKLEIISFLTTANPYINEDEGNPYDSRLPIPTMKLNLKSKTSTRKITPPTTQNIIAYSSENRMESSSPGQNRSKIKLSGSENEGKSYLVNIPPSYYVGEEIETQPLEFGARPIDNAETMEPTSNIFVTSGYNETSPSIMTDEDDLATLASESTEYMYEYESFSSEHQNWNNSSEFQQDASLEDHDFYVPLAIHKTTLDPSENMETELNTESLGEIISSNQTTNKISSGISYFEENYPEAAILQGVDTLPFGSKTSTTYPSEDIKDTTQNSSLDGSHITKKRQTTHSPFTTINESSADEMQTASDPSGSPLIHDSLVDKELMKLLSKYNSSQIQSLLQWLSKMQNDNLYPKSTTQALITKIAQFTSSLSTTPMTNTETSHSPLDLTQSSTTMLHKLITIASTLAVPSSTLPTESTSRSPFVRIPPKMKVTTLSRRSTLKSKPPSHPHSHHWFINNGVSSTNSAPNISSSSTGLEKLLQTMKSSTRTEQEPLTKDPKFQEKISNSRFLDEKTTPMSTTVTVTSKTKTNPSRDRLPTLDLRPSINEIHHILELLNPTHQNMEEVSSTSSPNLSHFEAPSYYAVENSARNTERNKSSSVHWIGRRKRESQTLKDGNSIENAISMNENETKPSRKLMSISETTKKKRFKKRLKRIKRTSTTTINPSYILEEVTKEQQKRQTNSLSKPNDKQGTSKSRRKMHIYHILVGPKQPSKLAITKEKTTESPNQIVSPAEQTTVEEPSHITTESVTIPTVSTPVPLPTATATFIALEEESSAELTSDSTMNVFLTESNHSLKDEKHEVKADQGMKGSKGRSSTLSISDSSVLSYPYSSSVGANPSIFRIPIPIVNSTPDYIQILGNPVAWPQPTPPTPSVNIEDILALINKGTSPPTPAPTTPPPSFYFPVEQMNKPPYNLGLSLNEVLTSAHKPSYPVNLLPIQNHDRKQLPILTGDDGRRYLFINGDYPALYPLYQEETTTTQSSAYLYPSLNYPAHHGLSANTLRDIQLSLGNIHNPIKNVHLNRPIIITQPNQGLPFPSSILINKIPNQSSNVNIPLNFLNSQFSNSNQLNTNQQSAVSILSNQLNTNLQLNNPLAGLPLSPQQSAVNILNNQFGVSSAGLPSINLQLPTSADTSPAPGIQFSQSANNLLLGNSNIPIVALLGNLNPTTTPPSVETTTTEPPTVEPSRPIANDPPRPIANDQPRPRPPPANDPGRPAVTVRPLSVFQRQSTTICTVCQPVGVTFAPSTTRRPFINKTPVPTKLSLIDILNLKLGKFGHKGLIPLVDLGRITAKWSVDPLSAIYNLLFWKGDRRSFGPERSIQANMTEENKKVLWHLAQRRLESILEELKGQATSNERFEIQKLLTNLSQELLEDIELQDKQVTFSGEEVPMPSEKTDEMNLVEALYYDPYDSITPSPYIHRKSFSIRKAGKRQGSNHEALEIKRKQLEANRNKPGTLKKKNGKFASRIRLQEIESNRNYPEIIGRYKAFNKMDHMFHRRSNNNHLRKR